MTTTVRSGQNVCRPFSIDVMVFSPESGYKVELSVERDCNSDNTETWKLNFLLSKKQTDGSFVDLVHVSFQAQTAEEAQGVQNTAFNGVNPVQAEALSSQAYPAAKDLVGIDNPTPEQTEPVHAALQQVAVAGAS